MTRSFAKSWAMFWIMWLGTCGILLANDLDTQIETILKVDKQGAGHAAAAPALQQLSKQPATALIPILRAMDGANPVATNWLRGAVEAIADRQPTGTPLPKQELEQFALDRTHTPDSRKLAYDLLVEIDSSAPDRLLPGMIDDPSVEFRRECVQRLIDAAADAEKASDAAVSQQLYLRAFNAALDLDQLELVSDALKELGKQPDLKRQLGLLDGWWLIGPFDNRGKIGFAAAYPPEAEVDVQKKYPGKEGEVAWVKKESESDRVVVDLNKIIAPHKGAVVYAFREFVSDRARPAELRLGTPNGWKMWVNGELAFGHEEYHFTMRMDQYIVPVTFKAGVNTILLKICQDEQSPDWAQRWQFQIRACDSTGKGILPVDARGVETAAATLK